MSDLDPLVKMAIIHHQFETIHPFYDGNGRTGRIINILYLVLQGLLDIPILYLSRFVVQNKDEYYRLLQVTRTSGNWEEWILFMLRGVAEIAQSTLETVKQIAKLMMETKHQIRAKLPKIYSQDLVNNLFQHPYTKIEFIMRDLGLSRPTASKYLKLLVKNGFLKEQQVGRTKYFINEKLVLALSNVEEGN